MVQIINSMLEISIDDVDILPGVNNKSGELEKITEPFQLQC